MKRRATCVTAAALILLSLCLTFATASAAAPQIVSTAAQNSAPVAENLELNTYRGVSVGGQLKATDPDGDAMTFSLTTPPIKGELSLNPDGSFVYAPLDGKKGKDYFGFRAADSNGNVSQEATVIISIAKQKTTIHYGDMDYSPDAYAALYLAENNVFVGEQLGGSYLFDAGRSVSRGEFLAMCMKVADAKLLSGVSRTGFSDDGDMPAWVKPYVSTALMTGVITGYEEDGGTVFDANAPVSYSEAAVILNRVLGVADVSTAGVNPGAAPDWACQSVANMEACDILPSGGDTQALSVTRGEAAEMLMNAMDLIRDR